MNKKCATDLLSFIELRKNKQLGNMSVGDLVQSIKSKERALVIDTLSKDNNWKIKPWYEDGKVGYFVDLTNFKVLKNAIYD
jgi:hypothetical protein